MIKAAFAFIFYIFNQIIPLLEHVIIVWYMYILYTPLLWSKATPGLIWPVLSMASSLSDANMH